MLLKYGIFTVGIAGRVVFTPGFITNGEMPVDTPSHCNVKKDLYTQSSGIEQGSGSDFRPHFDVIEVRHFYSWYSWKSGFHSWLYHQWGNACRHPKSL